MVYKKIIIISISILLIATFLPTVSSTDSSFINGRLFNNKIGGKSLNNIAQSKTLDINNLPRKSLYTPDYFSWRNYEGYDWTTPIRDQLQDVCGSCWAFGALGGMESNIKIWENNPNINIDLSEQYILSCSPGSCNGWYLSRTLSWIQHNGMITEECFPYQADDSIPCESKCSEWRSSLIGINNYEKITRGDINAIQEALIEYGPLPATMMVYDDFYPNYTGGVYKYTYGGLVFGHVITIVGYDNTWGGENEGYWICKNSWGTEWGENGWFKIAYGECEIEDNVYYLEGPNYSPLKPEKPIGPSNGKPGIKYAFSTSCIDPDGNKLYYWFDWGDGNDSDWLGPFDSGETVFINYTWFSEGTYQVKVKSLDILGSETDFGIESEWSDPLSISIPRNKFLSYFTLTFSFLEKHSNLFRLFR